MKEWIEYNLKFYKIVENYCNKISNNDWKSIFDKKHSKSKLNIDGKLVRPLVVRAIRNFYNQLENDFSNDTYYRVVVNRDEYDSIGSDVCLLDKDLCKKITKDIMNEFKIDESKRDDIREDVFEAFEFDLCQNMGYVINLFYKRSHIDREINEKLVECVELYD